MRPSFHFPRHCTSFWRRLAFCAVYCTTRDFERRYERASLREMVGCQTATDRLVNFALYDPREPEYEDWLADDVDRGVMIPHRDEFKSDEEYQAHIRKVGEAHVWSLPAHKRFRIIFSGLKRRRHWDD